MLFLATATLRDTRDAPRERMLGLIASTWATIDQLEKDGKVVTGGAYVGKRGGCIVADVDSHEDLAALLNRVPISGYLDWEVTPLVPAQSALESARWAVTQLQQREPATARAD
jgi:muconolactone delta-isomerase